MALGLQGMKSEPFVTGHDVVCRLPVKLEQGLVIGVYGFPKPNAYRFSVNLSCSETIRGGDIAFHAMFYFTESRVIVRNSFLKGSWGVEEKGGPTNPLQRDNPFYCTIKVLHDKFELAVNGQYLCDFRYRIPPTAANYVIVTDDAEVWDIHHGNYYYS